MIHGLKSKRKNKYKYGIIYDKYKFKKERKVLVIMSKVCEKCGKRPLVGNNVSHSNLKTKKRTLPNLQKVKVLLEDNKTTKRIRICTSCLKKGKIKKAI